MISLNNYQEKHEWWCDLKNLYFEFYGVKFTNIDWDNWVDYYEDGYTPKEALAEDAQC